MTDTTTNPYRLTDCHNPARTTGCYCDRRTEAAVSISDAAVNVVLPAVLTFLVEHTGESAEWIRTNTFLSAPGHEMTDAFGIAHEGHYDWPFALPESVRTLAAAHGIYVEVGAGWRLDLYPAA